MPSEKSARSAERQHVRSRSMRTRARTAVTGARRAIQTGDATAAEEAVRRAAATLDKMAQKGAVHPNNAARRKGRLARALSQSQKTREGAS